jgi:hypothetical protein
MNRISACKYRSPIFTIFDVTKVLTGDNYLLHFSKDRNAEKRCNGPNKEPHQWPAIFLSYLATLQMIRAKKLQGPEKVPSAPS